MLDRLMRAFKKEKTAPPRTAPTFAPAAPAVTQTRVKSRANIFALLAGAVMAFAPAACGRSPTDDDNPTKVIIIKGKTEPALCSAVASCPEFKPTWPPSQNPHYNEYLFSGRWVRHNPETGEEYKVCEPLERDFCEGDEMPQENMCEPPLCPDVQPCDPIPSRGSENEPVRRPQQAGFPTNSQHPYIDHIYGNPDAFPIIFDDIPDCTPERAELLKQGASYYHCDLLPTCEEKIPYCEPLPRCEDLQSPLSCSTDGSYLFGDLASCRDYMDRVRNLIRHWGVDIGPVLDRACQPSGDGTDGYRPPIIDVVCLPTPECKPGERPGLTPRAGVVDCEGLGMWTSTDPFAPSCDPIPSCKDE